MKNSIILLSALLLISCREGSKSQSSVVNGDGVEKNYYREKTDSFCEEILQKTKEEVESEKKSQSSSASRTSGSYSSSSRNDNEPEYDNMRGFDPASEDDMDDNGMSRYMENDDEEGWD